MYMQGIMDKLGSSLAFHLTRLASKQPIHITLADALDELAVTAGKPRATLREIAYDFCEARMQDIWLMALEYEWMLRHHLLNELHQLFHGVPYEELHRRLTSSRAFIDLRYLLIYIVHVKNIEQVLEDSLALLRYGVNLSGVLRLSR